LQKNKVREAGKGFLGLRGVIAILNRLMEGERAQDEGPCGPSQALRLLPF
jgi:hypothetical protein